MSETNNIVDLIGAGIKAENLRQKAIANNIANLETPGYRRVDVQFEEVLSKLLDSPGEVDLDDLGFEYYRPQNTPVNSKGNDVNLESEIGQMVKNALFHKAYIRLLNNKYKQIDAAINLK